MEVATNANVVQLWALGTNAQIIENGGHTGSSVHEAITKQIQAYQQCQHDELPDAIYINWEFWVFDGAYNAAGFGHVETATQ